MNVNLPILSLSSGFLAGAALLILSLYLASLAIYRLYLSPVAKFPGPKLAALSLWYEFYYDVIGRGQYCFEIDKLHDLYGTNIFLVTPGKG